MLPAEIDDVPDDQEVAGELQLLDQIELARDLRARLVVIRPVALARADVGDAAQKRHLRLAGRHRVVGEAIAQVRHRVLQAVGELARPRDGVWLIVEQRRDVGRRLEIALRVRREPPAGRREIGVMVDAGEDVEQRPLGVGGEAHAVGGDRRHAERAGEARERVVVARLVAAQMALQLHVHVAAAEDADQAIEQPADAVAAAVERRAAGERDQTRRAAVELVERQRAFAFRRAQLHARHEAAEIAVPVRTFAQDGEHGLAGRAGLAGRTIRTRRTCALRSAGPARRA